MKIKIPYRTLICLLQILICLIFLWIYYFHEVNVELGKVAFVTLNVWMAAAVICTGK